MGKICENVCKMTPPLSHPFLVIHSNSNSLHLLNRVKCVTFTRKIFGGVKFTHYLCGVIFTQH